MSSKIKISLAWQMMIGLALGIVVGALVDSSFAQTWLQPLGDLFIRLIRMVVVPLVLATIIAGAAGISDTSKLGRVARQGASRLCRDDRHRRGLRPALCRHHPAGHGP